MQVLLHSDGRIKLQYDNISQNSIEYYGEEFTFATIGIQNYERNDGITYLNPWVDNHDIYDGLAVVFQ